MMLDDDGINIYLKSSFFYFIIKIRLILDNFKYLIEFLLENIEINIIIRVFWVLNCVFI